MSTLILRHLDALAASMVLVNAQIDALRHQLAIEQQATAVKSARIALPERCTGIDADRCAMQEPDAKKTRGSFGSPNCWRCVGCRYESDGGDTA